jgi:hypothetical protein
MENNQRHFVALVAGENPESMMEKYDINLEVEPYILYKKEDSFELWENDVKELQFIINQGLAEKFGYTTDAVMNELKKLQNKGHEKCFEELALMYDKDADGNIISTENENGRWETYSYGNMFSQPFVLKNGQEVYQARVSDIDWEKMHHCNEEAYVVAWETVMEGVEPANDDERQIYENMKNRTHYFSNFKNKEAYVNYSTAYWTYAFVNEKDGWVEIEKESDEEWVNNFYNRFIQPLIEKAPNTLLTIFECRRY